MSGNTVLRSQVLNHGIGTTFAKVVVVILTTDGIRTTFHRYDVTLGIGHIGGKLVQRFLRLLGQVVLVKTKVDRSLGYNVVVIQIGDCVLQSIYAMDRIVRQGLGLRGLLAGALRLLVYLCRLRRHRLDGSLGTRIYVFNVS